MNTAPVGKDLQPLVMDLELYPVKEGLRVEATVTNPGSYPVSYLGGCIPGIQFALLDANGNELHLYCGPVIACPGWPVGLSPGETESAELLFQGEICKGPVDQLPLEPGKYQMVATLHYFVSSEIKPLEARRGFTWGDAAGGQQ